MAKVKRVVATVCPECKALNQLCTIEEVVQVYWFNAETEDFELRREDESEVVNVYCDECATYYDNTNIYDYIAELDENGNLVLGEELKKRLSKEEKEEVKKKLQKLL